MKIDAHQHFWKFDPVRDAWIDDAMTVLKQDFLPEELRREMACCDIEGCVAVQADQSEAETRFLLDLASANPFVKGVVGWVDLCADNVSERLAHFSENPLFKGVRHIVQAEPDPRFMLRKEFIRGIEKLSQYGLTYDILIFPKHLGTALELVRQFPEQPFAIDHMAKPLIRDQQFSPWEEEIKEIAQYQNVFCKVSGLITEANWHEWKPGHIEPYMDVVFEAFGTDRLMFGSDWPVCKLAGSYTTVTVLMEQYLKFLPAEDRAKVWGDNARRFYRL